MSETDYDRRVRDILDRVAQGHLSSEEGATLIAALTKPTQPTTPTTPAGPPAAATEPLVTPTESPAARTESSAGTRDDDAPSPSVWAEVVDSPDAADAVPGPSGQESVVDDAPLTSPAGAKPGEEVDEQADVRATAGQDAAAAADAAEEHVDKEPVDKEPVDKETIDKETIDAEPTEVEREAEHSNVPVPSGVRRVTIRAVGRRVRLIGEPAVNGVAVDGPHVIKRDGDTIAIGSEGDMGVSIDGFSMLRTRSVGDLKSHVNGFAKELSIRVNPMLDVEVEVTGGSVTAERLPGLQRVRVTAGTAKVTDVDGPIDLLVQAGSAHLDAQLTKGRSRVRVESGAATVNLRRGSDVRVHTESQLGRVTWTGAVNGPSKDVEIGRGRGALDVEVLVGTAQIASD